MRYDLRDAFRSLSKNPGLTFFTVSILAVAFTAAGLVLGLVNGVLVRPFPFPHAERLVMLWDTHGKQPQVLEMTSLSNYLDYRSQSLAFHDMAAWPYSCLDGAKRVGIAMLHRRIRPAWQ